MHVAILTHTFFPVVGGAEVGIHEIAARLARRDEVTVVTSMSSAYRDPFASASQVGERAEDYEVLRYEPVLTRPSRWSRAVQLASLRELRVLRALHRRHPIDVVNVHFAAPYGLIALWARFALHVPVVVTLIGRSDVARDLSPAMRRHLRMGLRFATATTQITGYCLQGFPYRGSPAVEVPYGVDVERYRAARARPKRSDVVRLITVQRLSPAKRVDAVIHVMAELERRAPGRFRLSIVGQGSEQAALERLAAELSVSSIDFLGFLDEDDLAIELASSDLFVTHTMSETFGVVFAEAMASSLPIVAARSSSVPFVVEDGVNGRLVEPFDYRGFADAVEELADSPERRGEIRVRNRREAEMRYDWEHIADRFREVLDRARGYRGRGD